MEEAPVAFSDDNQRIPGLGRCSLKATVAVAFKLQRTPFLLFLRYNSRYTRKVL
jgi:hypothetical protein